MQRKIDLSIVVPAHNEEELLPGFLKEATTYLKRANPDYELIVVENGSQDKTLEIAQSFSKKNSRIKIKHLSNPNYGEAMIWGIKKAVGKQIIIFNVDFWDRRFIELTKVDLLGYDVVVGSKNLPSSGDRRPLGRRFVTKGYNLLLKIFFGYKGTDTHGIKVYRSSKILPVLKRCKTKTGIFDSEIIIRSQRMGLKILELPVVVEEKRPNRFGIKRILETPNDLVKLYLAFRQ